MKKVDLAYLAGYFDGEGSINIDRDYRLNCSVTSVNRWILELFRFNFGGGLAKNSPRESYIWHIHSVNAMEFLKAICGYLRLKKAEALLAIDFQTRKEARKAARHYTGCHQELTDEELAVREATRILMQNLKREPGHNVKPPRGSDYAGSQCKRYMDKKSEELLQQ
jgi:hypothetical protein